MKMPSISICHSQNSILPAENCKPTLVLIYYIMLFEKTFSLFLYSLYREYMLLGELKNHIRIVDLVMQKYGRAKLTNEWFWIRMKDFDLLSDIDHIATSRYERYVLESGNRLDYD